MALTYSQWVWGFEIFDSGSTQNNKLDFSRTAGNNPPGTVVALLNAGVYTADEVATEVARAMNAVDTNTTGLASGKTAEYTCSFDFSTLKFTITNNEATPASFTMKQHDGANLATSPWTLLGFDTAAANSAGTSVTSNVAVGTSPSSASLWAAAEPLAWTSPVSAQAVPSPALLTQRAIRAMQQVSDGGTIESIYITSVKKVRVAFRCLLPSEQTKMEAFLDWAVQGKHLTWQPDKTSANAMKLVLVNPGQINNAFEWLTRSETGYGVLTFVEQTS